MTTMAFPKRFVDHLPELLSGDSIKEEKARPSERESVRGSAFGACASTLSMQVATTVQRFETPRVEIPVELPDYGSHPGEEVTKSQN